MVEADEAVVAGAARGKSTATAAAIAAAVAGTDSIAASGAGTAAAAAAATAAATTTAATDANANIDPVTAALHARLRSDHAAWEEVDVSELQSHGVKPAGECRLHSLVLFPLIMECLVHIVSFALDLKRRFSRGVLNTHGISTRVVFCRSR